MKEANWSEWKDIPEQRWTAPPSTRSKTLMSDTEYSFQVRGINSGGDGSESQNADAVPFHVSIRPDHHLT